MLVKNCFSTMSKFHYFFGGIIVDIRCFFLLENRNILEIQKKVLLKLNDTTLALPKKKKNDTTLDEINFY